MQERGARRRRTRAAYVHAVVLVLVVAATTVDVVRHLWVADDLFITFRYTDNLLAGHGAVYNTGERVEGYTHFLWFALLAAGRALGVDPVWLGRWVALPAFLGSLVWLVRLSGRLWLGRGGLWGVPVAALAWALLEDARRFASGGLETAAFTWMLLIGVGALLDSDPRQRGRSAAWAFAISVLLRPEGLLYSALAMAFLAWKAGSDRRVVRDAVLTWLALVVPLFVFRLAYYGSPLPNPYYAKSGAGSYWTQGWIYARVYFGCYWPLLLAPLGAVAIAAGLRANASTEAQRRGRLLLFLLVAATLTILYVVRVGGDFMFARFFLPVTPFLLLLVEAAIHSLRQTALRLAAAVACCALIVYGAARKHALFHDKRDVAEIVDEWQYYSSTRLAEVRATATTLRRCFAGTRAKILVDGGQAALAYFAQFPVAIERFGLTDATIAHQPIVRRGRPGHEKPAAVGYLYQRGLNIRFFYRALRSAPMYTLLRLGGVDGDIVVYDRAVMEHLKSCGGASFVDFPRWLEQVYIPTVAEKPRRRLIADWAQFQHFYFAHNPDPEGLRDELRAALARAGIETLPDSLPPALSQDSGSLRH